MQSPAASDRDANWSLYGGRSASINRRSLIAAGIGAALLAVEAPAGARRAISAISWEGRAHANVGGRELDLIAHTRIALPFAVRSTSWIVADGPSAARTLVLDLVNAHVEIDGTQRPLPTQVAIHERQQYLIYLQLLAALGKRHRPGARFRLRDALIPIDFTAGDDGRPVKADVTVDAPESDKPPIAEHFRFGGVIDHEGIAWPKRIDIEQNGKSYFTLQIDRFRVERA